MNTSEYLDSLREELKGEKAEPEKGTKKLLEIAGNEEKIGELIDTLSDVSASKETKLSALHALHTVSVFSPVLPTKMPDYVNALRGLMDSDDPGIRRQAFGSLAVMKDDVAQSRIREELVSDKNEEDKLIKTHHAIALLGFDEKALDHALLKKIAKNPPNDECLIEAVRHMPSGDPDSAELLLEIMEDDSKPLAARNLVPDKINNAAPADFLKSARKIIDEKGLGHDLAPYLVSGVNTIEDQKVKLEVDETKTLFRKLMKDAPASFRAAAGDLLEEE